MEVSEILAEWEFDSEAPPRVITSVREGDLRIALLEEANKERRVVFRLRTDDGSWTVAKGTPYFLPYYGSHSYQLSADGLSATVSQARVSGCICRVFFWSQRTSNWRISLAPAGVGLCQAVAKYGLASAATPFAANCAVDKLRSSQAQDWLGEEVAKEDSVFRFAQRFHLMEREEKMVQVFGGDSAFLHRGRDELESLMRYALQSDVSLWKKQDGTSWRIGARQGSQILDDPTYGHWSEVDSPYLHQWSHVLRRVGPLQPHLSTPTLQHFWNGVQHIAQVSVEAPSYHEQLEARLELREWAREHLPPDVWAELERVGS